MWLLRGGLVLSVLLFAIGSIVGLLHGATEAPAVKLSTLSVERPGSTIAGLGVLILAATPLVRVLSLLSLWTKERDYRFALVAAFVAFVLVSAILSGQSG